MNHPYKRYEGTNLWNTVMKAIDALTDNQDLIQNTPTEYIVGYICQSLWGKQLDLPLGESLLDERREEEA